MQMKHQNRFLFFDKIVLNHQQNSLKLEFSSLHLNEPKRNIYKYKLEGYDNDWMYTTGDRNYASYSNLPSGTYSFQVKGTNNDGVWFEDNTSLNVRIKPSPWLSTMAIFLYCFILLIVFIFLRNAYHNRSKSKEEIKAIRFEKEKNEEIALSKQRLFTNISHDFLTPLNLILGPINTLNKSNKLSASDSVLVSLIEKNAKRVHSLINQLLDIRKIETNTLHLNLERFDVIELCQKQYDSFLEMAERKQINFRFEATNESFIFDGDRIRLESIIQNLLSNAFKFTPSTGTITIRIETETQSVIRIIVTDNGIGIPDEKRDLLFERFHHEESDATNITGNGIGLNIAKEYCDIMNGKIWYESELGKGSTFYVELPFQWIDSKEGPIERASENRLTDTGGSNNHIPYINRDLPILLLVEDDADTLKYLEFSLKDEYSILSSNNGKEALEVLKRIRSILL